jgi:hypothetical protein
MPEYLFCLFLAFCSMGVEVATCRARVRIPAQKPYHPEQQSHRRTLHNDLATHRLGTDIGDRIHDRTTVASKMTPPASNAPPTWGLSCLYIPLDHKSSSAAACTTNNQKAWISVPQLSPRAEFQVLPLYAFVHRPPLKATRKPSRTACG